MASWPKDRSRSNSRYVTERIIVRLALEGDELLDLLKLQVEVLGTLLTLA